MIPRSRSSPLGGENIIGGPMKPKKKAPPRPPQPSHSKLVTSQSFQSTASVGFRSMPGDDLINFDTPPSDPVSTTHQINQPKEFMYRVGASIFYIKSPLKNSSRENTNQQMPFSPPRPSAQNLLMSTPVKSNNMSNSGMPALNPTVIRSQGGNSVHQGNGNNVNNNSWNASSQGAAQGKYSNVPLVWDEPPKKVAPKQPPPLLPKPTIIRPASTALPPPPPAPAPALAPVLAPTVLKPIVAATVPTNTSTSSNRNYYDLPPEDLDDEDDGDDTSFSPPMPNEPPPPPPPELDNEWDQDWDEGSNGTSVANSEEKFSDLQVGNDGDRAYAIALYDYVPEQEGDLALKAGDVVYLIKIIDDSWLYGSSDGAYGMFPTNYVNIVVPLPPEDSTSTTSYEDTANYESTANYANATTFEDTTNYENNPPPPVDEVVSPSSSNGGYNFAKVLYTFNAEADGDLQLEAGDTVTVWGRINDEWLYGSANRKQGQFPANFVGPVPDDLPILDL